MLRPVGVVMVEVNSRSRGCAKDSLAGLAPPRRIQQTPAGLPEQSHPEAMHHMFIIGLTVDTTHRNYDEAHYDNMSPVRRPGQPYLEDTSLLGCSSMSYP